MTICYWLIFGARWYDCLFYSSENVTTWHRRRGKTSQLGTQLFTSRCQASHRFWVLVQRDRGPVSFTMHAGWKLTVVIEKVEEGKPRWFTWVPGSSWNEEWLPGISGLHPSLQQGRFSADGHLWPSPKRRHTGDRALKSKHKSFEATKNHFNISCKNSAQNSDNAGVISLSLLFPTMIYCRHCLRVMCKLLLYLFPM